MRNRGKVAVTIDPELLDRIEEMRKLTGETRSAVFERAIEAYVANASQAELARRYVDAYRRQPERAVEQREALATSLEALATEPYDAPR